MPLPPHPCAPRTAKSSILTWPLPELCYSFVSLFWHLKVKFHNAFKKVPFKFHNAFKGVHLKVFFVTFLAFALPKHAPKMHLARRATFEGSPTRNPSFGVARGQDGPRKGTKRLHRKIHQCTGRWVPNSAQKSMRKEFNSTHVAKRAASGPNMSSR